MKTRNQIRKKQGFTLIELLVVIVIIGILAGMLFPTFGWVRRMAKVRATHLLAKQIESACKQYWMEYNHWPSSTIVDANFTMMLQGSNIWYNSRNIVFLEVDSSKATTNGALRVPIDTGTSCFQVRFAGGAGGTSSAEWLSLNNGLGTTIVSQRVSVIVWAENPYVPSNNPARWIGSWQ